MQAFLRKQNQPEEIEPVLTKDMEEEILRRKRAREMAKKGPSKHNKKNDPPSFRTGLEADRFSAEVHALEKIDRKAYTNYKEILGGWTIRHHRNARDLELQLYQLEKQKRETKDLWHIYDSMNYKALKEEYRKKEKPENYEHLKRHAKEYTELQNLLSAKLEQIRDKIQSLSRRLEVERTTYSNLLEAKIKELQENDFELLTNGRLYSAMKAEGKEPDEYLGLSRRRREASSTTPSSKKLRQEPSPDKHSGGAGSEAVHPKEHLLASKKKESSTTTKSSDHTSRQEEEPPPPPPPLSHAEFELIEKQPDFLTGYDDDEYVLAESDRDWGDMDGPRKPSGYAGLERRR